MDSRQVACSVFGHPSRAFTVKLWNGSTLPAHFDRAPGSELVLRDADAVELFVPPVSERRLAEAYIAQYESSEQTARTMRRVTMREVHP